MKTSWKAMLGAVLVLAIAAPAAQAQGGGQRGGMRGGGARMMEMLLKDITLDAAQQTKVDAIKAKYEKEMPPMTPGAPPDSATRAKRRELTMKEQDEIRLVLTEEQKKVFDKNVAEMRERMQRRSPA